MQDNLSAISDRLPLADPAAVFGAPELDGASLRQALHNALIRLPALVGLPPRADRQRLLAEAGRILLAEPARLAEAIHLTRTADPDLADTAPLAHVRLVALWRSGDRDGTIAEADRVLALPHHSPRERQIMRASLISWRIEDSLPARMEFLADYWPDLQSAVKDPYETLMREEGDFVTNGFQQKIVHALGHGDDADFLRRLVWGFEWHRRILFTRLLALRILQETQPDRRSMTEQAVLDLFAKLKSIFRHPDLSALTAACAAGRSVLVVQAHAGLITLADYGLRSLPFPVTSVSMSHSPVPANRPEDTHLATSAPDAALEFAKLGKAMKKSARIVSLFPDGPYGEQTQIQVLGRSVPIGRGGSFLAWHGKADVFFVGTRWNGPEVNFTVDPGPRAVDHADRDGFETAYNRFYAQCLERVLQGPPEDMVPKAGFWPRFVS